MTVIWSDGVSWAAYTPLKTGSKLIENPQTGERALERSWSAPGGRVGSRQTETRNRESHAGM